MRLQKATMFGLYAVLELAVHGDRQISAPEIAMKYDISLNHLAKVLRTLVRARLIESVRGAGGGYRFCGNPKRVTLLDVIELFEDPRSEARGGETGGSEEKRALDGVLKEIDDITIATLRAVSITTLVKLIEKRQRGEEAQRDKPLRSKAVAGE